MKQFKVYFEVRGRTFRMVSAENEQEAAEQVDGDMIDINDIENADLDSISVDEVYEELPAKKKKKK